MKRFIYSLVVLLPFFTACQSREQKLVNSIENFVNEVKANDSIFTTDDWTSADQEIANFNNEFQEVRNSLTDAERSKINDLLGQYQGLRIKRGLKDFKNSLEDLGEQIQGAAKVFVDSTKK